MNNSMLNSTKPSLTLNSSQSTTTKNTFMFRHKTNKFVEMAIANVPSIDPIIYLYSLINIKVLALTNITVQLCFFKYGCSSAWLGDNL